MRFGLVSTVMKSGQLEGNLNIMRQHMVKNRGKLDVLCFGESFLTGYSSLTYETDKDLYQALESDDNLIKLLSIWTQKYKVALSFGYFEKDEEDNLYSSVMFIGRNGEIINNYRRRSIGWNQQKMDESVYKLGDCLIPFDYEGKRMVTIICQDMMSDQIFNELKKLEIDVVMWPVYRKGGSLQDYLDLEQFKHLKTPVLMVNTYDEQALGGCAYFKDGELVDSIKETQTGVLVVDIDK